MNTDTITWADGHGRWHVTLPEGVAVTDAAHEITIELFARTNRDEVYRDIFDYVCENLVELPSDTEGRVHFAEYNI